MNSQLRNSLEAAGRTHVRHRVLRLLLKALPWVILVIVLLFAIDILLHLPPGARAVLRNALLGVSLLLLGTAAAVACFRREPILRTARVVEDRMPELDSRLINILQLEEQVDDPDKPELTRKLARRAVDDAAANLPMQRFRAAVRSPRLPRALGIAAIAPALLFLVTLISGEPGSRQWARFLDPHGDHPPLSFTNLSIEEPQQDGFAIPYRDGFKVMIRASGHRPREVFLTATDLDGTKLFTLPTSEVAKNEFSLQVDDVRQPMLIYAHLSDESARSTRRQIDVILEPRIERAWVKVDPPAYTGRTGKEIPFRFNGVRALAGSQVGFTIESNRPLGESEIRYESPGEELRRHPLVVVDETQPNRVAGFVPANATGRLTFHIRDQDGRPADEIPSTSITVTRDAGPAVTLLFPGEDTFVVETMTIELIAEAADDIGLGAMRLHTAIDGKFGDPETARFEKPGEALHRINRPLDLAALGLKAGQTITVFADAIDLSPEPQFSSTERRTLTLISEDDYNDYLRREADVALIAGKYERALERLNEAIEEQKRIEEALAAAKELPPEEATAKVGEALQRQEDLNRELEDIAGDLREVTRENPVYDFEKDLGKSLTERADEIEESVEQNRRDLEEALSESATGEPVQPQEREQLEQAAADQRERLEGEQDAADEQVRQPLEDLADFHEMLKNFNQLRELAEQQRQLADEAAAADRGEPLTPEDKAALRDMANRQRQLGQRMNELQEKLRQDAERLEEEMPEVAEAAEQLADQLEDNGLPGQARDAAQEMLEGDAPGARQQAQRLQEQLEQMLGQQGQAGERAAGEALGQMLGRMGMAQGNNFQQLLQSLRFLPPGMGQGMAQGGGGQGMMGQLAQGMMDGSPQAMLGGESLMGGDIARRMMGMGGGPGTGGGAGSPVDSVELAAEALRSQRRTFTPEAESLLLEYEDIADAYFERLTTPTP
ncbi:MAG: hypothetical protein AAGB14_08620 [Verrucomicrobiota bacterium]